jgi:hypothetical protein
MDRLVVVEWQGPGRYDYVVTPILSEPPWVDDLRRLSQLPVPVQSTAVGSNIF